MADRYTTIRGKQILADSIEPSDLKATNSPADTYIPIYDNASAEFKWIKKSYMQIPVLDKDLITPPSGPSTGDRYLIIFASLDQSQTSYDSEYYIGGSNYSAQTFKAGASGDLKIVKVRLRKVGSPADLVVEIRNVVDSKPGSTIHASEEVAAGSISTSASEITVTFSTPYGVTANTDYAIVLHQKADGGDVSNNYQVATDSNNPYANGAHCVTDDSGSNWTINSAHDFYFKTYLDAGTWDGHDNDIAEWNGSSWDFDTPAEGWYVDVVDENNLYRFDGTNWNLFVGSGIADIVDDTTPQLGGNLDMNGYSIGGNSEAQLDDAVAKKHTQNSDTDLDATFEATFVKKTDTVNVLSDITSAGADIEDAVTKKHTQNSDTALGAQSEDLDMNTHKITGVVDPVSDQDAATKKYVVDNFGDMDYADTRCKIGTFTRDVSIASGTQQITGIGFTPKAVHFFANIDGTNMHSVGFSVYGQDAKCVYSPNWSATPTTGFFSVSGGSFAIIFLIDSSNYYYGYISAVADGSFTITWTKNGSPTGTATIGYVAFR